MRAYTPRVSAAAIVSLLVAAISPVSVLDDGCPSGADVEAALTSMLAPQREPRSNQDVAQLEHRTNALHVELRDSDGVIIAERMLNEGASCPELARLAAVIIATWESDVHPEFLRPLADIDRRVAPSPPSPPDRRTVAPSAAAYDVAAGLTLGQADTLAAGASIGAAWFPRGSGLGVWALGAGDITRTIHLGPHEARWRRWTASLELAHRWTRHRLSIDGHGGVTAGWVTTQGVDYVRNQSASTTAVGATAGIRSSWWISRHVGVWGDLRAFYFPSRDFIYATSAGVTAAEAPVPSWGGVASIGLALGRAPLSR